MAKLIDENSTPSTKSELDLFTVPPTQVAVKRSFWAEIYPKNPITDDGPYDFHITPDVYMLDLAKNYVYLTLQVVKPNGTDCATTIDAQTGALGGDLAFPINLLGKTFFKQIKIYLNNKLISDSGDKYSYRAYLETVLNFSQEAKETQLQAAGYYEDGTSDNLLENDGYKKRLARFKDSSVVELMAPIHADMFMQERYLISQSDLRIEMYRNSDAFCLIDPAARGQNYKIRVKSMCLYMRKVEVSDSINLAIETMLQNTTIKYPIRRTQITTLHITENRRSTPLNALFTGITPRRLVVGLVKAEALRGNYNLSPFDFQDFGISEIKLTSSTVTLPNTPYKLNFDENKYVRAFVDMFEGLNVGNDNRGNAINLESFKKGKTFFVFDLSADQSDSTYWQLIKEGSTSLEILFQKNLPANGLECVIFAEFDSMLFVDHARQTYLDFTV